MVSELIKEDLKKNCGKIVLIFLNNGFRFEGLILACDEEFLKIKDFKRNSEKFIKLNEIVEAELKNGNN